MMHRLRAQTGHPVNGHGLAPVLAVWTHITIERLAPVTDVSNEERAQITALVGQDCAALEPWYAPASLEAAMSANCLLA